MTVDRLAWLVYALITAVGIGYWIVPPSPQAPGSAPLVVEQRAEHVEPARPPSTPLATSPSAPVPHVVNTAGRAMEAWTAGADVPASAPELLARMRPVLNRGTNLSVAARDFRDAVEFAAVAHAARNTRVPFMVLKHRVVNEGMSLAEAIRASLPQDDADVHADLAFAEARTDLASLPR